MLRLQPLPSPLTTTQNPRLHHSPLLSLQLSTQTSRARDSPSTAAAPSTSSNRGSPTRPLRATPLLHKLPGAGALPPRFFVGHSIYKGKAALTVEPRAPDFTPLDSGAFKLSKEGFVLLHFAPAAGVRQYDQNRKQVFSLSVTENGNLVSLGARDSCEFFHDPFKGKKKAIFPHCEKKNTSIFVFSSGTDIGMQQACEEGKVRKVLKVEPLPDGSGHFFNLSNSLFSSHLRSVQNKLLNVDESFYIPITRAEYTVLISAFNFILPFLLGWHAFANSIKPDDTSRVNSANSSCGGDFEWSR